MWVLKLGGSWIKNPKLKTLIKLITLQNKNVIALVVGGGLFADSVRQAQKYTIHTLVPPGLRSVINYHGTKVVHLGLVHVGLLGRGCCFGAASVPSQTS